MSILIVCIFGFIAGFINSIAGGGGLISLPAILLTGLPAHIALGTNKLQAVSGAIMANTMYITKKKVVWVMALIGIPFSLIGSITGAKLTFYFSNEILVKIIIFLLPPVTILMFLSNILLKHKNIEKKINKKNIFLIIFICLVMGLYDGFFGPGTGTFLILLIVILMKIPLINASATAHLLNLTSNMGAFITFMISGSVNYKIAIPMAIANITGSLIGSSLAIKKGNKLIQNFVYIAIGILFIYLIWNNYIK